MTFDDFDFHPDLADGLYSMGFDTPTPIQAQAIPIILKNKDLIAVAQTGTGKTAAYLLPILDKISQRKERFLDTLVLAPTRELALQIDQQVEGFSYFTSVSSIPVYGGGDGAAWVQQKKALTQGADIIIATPGRLMALLQSGEISFTRLQHLVLDEADRMLDMGFFDDILRIISYLPVERQTVLFSATMPPKIRTLASKILRDPVSVSIAISKPAEGILQQAYCTYDTQKIPLLREILKQPDADGSVLIFASTKEKVKQLERDLQRIGLPIKGFHSDLEQAEREEILRAFRNRDLKILVGTDIISRGIDVDGISLVVNYDVPPDPEDYVHRIGRTARAETTGTAITFINERDQGKFLRIETLIDREIPKLPMPVRLGEGPAYTPKERRHEEKRPPGKSGKKFFGKRK